MAATLQLHQGAAWVISILRHGKGQAMRVCMALHCLSIPAVSSSCYGPASQRLSLAEIGACRHCNHTCNQETFETKPHLQ